MDDPRINVADLDNPEKIKAAVESLRKSIGVPNLLTRDDEPYARFFYRTRPQYSIWNRDRMNRELIKAGQGNNVPVRVRMDLAARQATLS